MSERLLHLIKHFEANEDLELTQDPYWHELKRILGLHQEVPEGVFARFGNDDLERWFSLSYASFTVLPRVLMTAMDDEWQGRMAALLNEMDATFTNVPGQSFTVRCTDDNGRMVKTPGWMLNYRHPNRDLINSFRKQEAANASHP